MLAEFHQFRPHPNIFAPRRFIHREITICTAQPIATKGAKKLLKPHIGFVFSFDDGIRFVYDRVSSRVYGTIAQRGEAEPEAPIRGGLERDAAGSDRQSGVRRGGLPETEPVERFDPEGSSEDLKGSGGRG
jgi:hypothetical protein